MRLSSILVLEAELLLRLSLLELQSCDLESQLD